MKKELHPAALLCAILFFTFFKVSSQTVSVWNGSVNNSWALADNWTPAAIPDNASVVSIVATANQPVIFDDAYANTITMDANTTLTVQSGFDLTITDVLTVDASATLIVKSDANLMQLNNTSNVGKITVERNSAALMRQDYTLWSAPVANQNLLAFSPQTVATRFYTYNSGTNFYNAIVPSTSTFAAAQGYLIRMPNNHPSTATTWNGKFTGVPNNGDIPVTMNNGGEGFSFNLVGNPYPSPLDMASFVSDNENNITGTIYFWRETNGNTANSAYCTWAGGTFTSNGQAQANNPEGIIQIGQGFFVEAKAGYTSLLFQNSQRDTQNNTAFLRNVPIERNTVWLNLTNESGAFSQMAVGYISGATAGVDLFDGKYLGDGTTALSSRLNNIDYTIQGLALPFDPADVVYLSFKVATAGDYTIAIDHTMGLFEEDQNVFIKDNFTGVIQNLKMASYTFTTTAGNFENRFELLYDTSLATNQSVSVASGITAYKQQQQIIINSGTMPMNKVQLFDISGRLLIESHNINATDARFDSSLSNGLIMVRITLETGEVVTKKVIN
jgi:hypothetical protein